MTPCKICHIYNLMNKYSTMSVTSVIHDETKNHSRNITANTLTTEQ